MTLCDFRGETWADRKWSLDQLLAPLRTNTSEALALWRAVARQTLFTDVLRVIGDLVAERAADGRLGRETRRSLVFSLVIESLHAFREGREPAVPAASVIDDVGTVVNPIGLKGQIHGGVAQGLGQALMEQVVYDRESGQNLTGSFMDYCMPRADTMPHMEITSNPVPTKRNPLGAKGAGEAGTVGALPAIVNAVIDALAPLGVKGLDMPATSERIWEAMRYARA
jgi:hypothetical protein